MGLKALSRGRLQEPLSVAPLTLKAANSSDYFCKHQSPRAASVCGAEPAAARAAPEAAAQWEMPCAGDWSHGMAHFAETSRSWPRARGAPEKCMASAPPWCKKCLAERGTLTNSDPNGCVDIKPGLGVVYGIVDFLGASFGFVDTTFYLRAPFHFAVVVLDVPMKWEVKSPLQFVRLFGSLGNIRLFVFRR